MSKPVFPHVPDDGYNPKETPIYIKALDHENQFPLIQEVLLPFRDEQNEQI